MNAETPKAEELNLPQAVLLLATNDKDGEPVVPQTVLRAAVAGATLAELDLIGAVELQGKHVRTTGTVPSTDFQHQLQLIRDKSRPHTPKRWVSMLESRAELHRIYEGMASLGVVAHVGERHLGLFRTTRYPEKDHAPEAALMEKIQAALSGAPPEPAKPDAEAPDVAPAKPDTKTVSKAPDARITALIALLQAAGLFGKLFPAADRGRASELAKDYWPSRAVEDELLMVRLAQEEEATL